MGKVGLSGYSAAVVKNISAGRLRILSVPAAFVVLAGAEAVGRGVESMLPGALFTVCRSSSKRANQSFRLLKI